MEGRSPRAPFSGAGPILGEVGLAFAVVERLGSPSHDDESAHDCLTADREVVGQLLDLLVAPVARPVRPGQQWMSQEGVTRHQDGSGDSVAVDLHAFVGALRVAADLEWVADPILAEHQVRQLVHQA